MQPISNYWGIGGTKAHCLLNSGCEGTIMSPNLMHTAKLQTVPLEQLVNLQLAVVGSCSIVNYGTSGSLKFGDFISDEYFDITNVDYYNVILGTQFPKKWGVSLGFSSQGRIKIKGWIIPQGRSAEQTKTLNTVGTHVEHISSY
jgi:hypothetical protein